MQAVIATGGKQYRVTEGTVLKVEKLAGEPGDQIVLDQVLMLSDGEGNCKVGSPLLEGARVTAQLIEQGKEKKVIVYKYKKRKNYHKKQGHRQSYTKLVIQTIEG